MMKALTKPPLLAQISMGRSKKLMVFPTDDAEGSKGRCDEGAVEDAVTALGAIDAEVTAHLSRRTARTRSTDGRASVTLTSRSQQRKRSSAAGHPPLRKASSARQGVASNQRVSEAAAARAKIRGAGFVAGEGAMRRAKSQKITKRRRNTSGSTSGAEYNMKVGIVPRVCAYTY
jgi:hypothetical protein